MIRLGFLAVLLLGMASLFPTSMGFSSRTVGDVRILGEEEVVFDWTIDRCSMNDIPDLPARAFRDANGRVQLIATHSVNRRMIGESLDSIQRDCQVIMDSHRDRDPAHFDYKEWIGATYTLDGETIHALVHMEYEAHQALRWFGRRDFSSTQGRKNWYYQEWNGFSYEDMDFNAQHNRWQGSRKFCRIGPHWVHPHGLCEATRKWVSPVNATVNIRGNARDLNAGGGDGVVVRILKGSEELWAKTIANGDTEGYDFDIEVPVQTGDAIYFRVNQRNDHTFDSTFFNPRITPVPDPCPSGKQRKCQMTAITSAQSIDKGRTYAHPPAPDHLVASVPYRYEPDTGPWGMWGQSNIIHNDKDGYYYAMVGRVDRFNGKGGTCVIRTETLDDPKSWRAWDGEDFSMRFINPYTEADADPVQHVCPWVSQDEIRFMHESVTYNAYFDKFLLVGRAGKRIQGELVQGFYYSLSDDLIHWTPRKLLMEAQLQREPCDEDSVRYPSLIDPDDTSRNFETTDRRPYLYFTRLHPCTSANRGLDRDLVRVRIEFNK